MELSKYMGKYVRIDLNNGYYYSGKVINADKDFIELIDKNEKLVTLKNEIISYIREVDNE